MAIMDLRFFGRLLCRGQSETLDFKADQYKFERATDVRVMLGVKIFLLSYLVWGDPSKFRGIDLNEHGL